MEGQMDGEGANSYISCPPPNTKYHSCIIRIPWIIDGPPNLTQSYRLKVRFIFLAKECKRRTVCPHAALISFHST